MAKVSSVVLASLEASTDGTEAKSTPSRVLESSGSRDAWQIPPQPFTRCGLADRTFSAPSTIQSIQICEKRVCVLLTHRWFVPAAVYA